MAKRAFAETCNSQVPHVDRNPPAAVSASSADSLPPKLAALTAPWCYNRIVRLTERHVHEFALHDAALGSFAVAKLPDEQVISEWLDSCCQGDLSWLPWSALIFEADFAEGEYYAVSDPDEPNGGRFDLELADPRLPLITSELTALYVTVVADFVGKVTLMNSEQKVPVLRKYESHWGYEAVRESVQAIHAGIERATQIVQHHNVENKLMTAWRNKLIEQQESAVAVDH